MRYGRHLTFWLLTFLVLCALLWLLREVLLPFVAGLALAYVQAPLADRLERLGLNRTIAALLIVATVVLVLLALALIVVPLAVQQSLALAFNIPGYVTRIRELIADPERPWLHWLATDNPATSMSDFMRYASGWLTTFATSLWAGGKALVSFASILIIMPVVTFYLICDWHGMLDIVDSWVPQRNRETVREIAREIDLAMSGFLRGQLGVCFFLGLYYAIALTLVGLNFGLLI
jgi:predicted PurR-regulated permease PerM